MFLSNSGSKHSKGQRYGKTEDVVSEVYEVLRRSPAEMAIERMGSSEVEKFGRREEILNSQF